MTRRRLRIGEAEHRRPAARRPLCCSMAVRSRVDGSPRGVELRHRVSGVAAGLALREAPRLRERGRNSVCSTGPRGTVSSGFQGPADFERERSVRSQSTRPNCSCPGRSASPPRELHGVLRLNSCGTVSFSREALRERRESTLISAAASGVGMAADSEAPMLRTRGHCAALRREAAQACSDGSSCFALGAAGCGPAATRRCGERAASAARPLVGASLRPFCLQGTSAGLPSLLSRTAMLASAFSSFCTGSCLSRSTVAAGMSAVLSGWWFVQVVGRGAKEA
mmetsp:Transcript_90648/g.234032  ORF Transcript_90648/g.234032 Transcript_90648/m.234032 type:complete len:281 (+) Transcript_90648:1298-2140(+)